MKILMFSYLPPVLSGIATHTYKLSKKLMKRGHEVEVLSFLNETGEKDGIKIHGIKSHIDLQDIYSIKTPLAVEKIKKVIKKSDPDILHVHHRTSSIEFFLDEIKSDIPMVNTVHSSTGNLSLNPKDTIHYFHYKKLSKELSKHSDFVITVSNYNKEKLIENGVKKEKVKTLRNGIDVKDFDITKKKARKKLGIKNNENIILFVGRHVKEKGLGYLLKAFKGIDNAKLLALGEGPLTEFYKNLYSYENVEFCGNIPWENVPYYYCASDVFVMPSIHPEPQGIVLMEAMASKTPVVATDIGGIPEVVKDCKAGILVEPESKEKIQKAIEKLLGDKKLRKKYSKNGYKNVKKKYSWEDVAKKTEKIYKKVL